MPKTLERVVNIAENCEKWLENGLAGNFRLIEVPRLISATILVWPIQDTIFWFELVRDLRAYFTACPKATTYKMNGELDKWQH